jgi:hypothetical protein
MRLKEGSGTLTLMSLLWSTMNVQFPNIWFSQYGQLGSKTIVVKDGVEIKAVELSEGAASWLTVLRINNITLDLLKNGFVQMAKIYPTLPVEQQAFPPNCYQFCSYCLRNNEVPSLTEVVILLANSEYIQGSVVEKYKHPLVYAIACDNISFSQLKQSQSAAEKAIKLNYEKHKNSYADFLPEHYPATKKLEQQKAAIRYGESPIIDKIKQLHKQTYE